jgi:hypothetical protein
MIGSGVSGFAWHSHLIDSLALWFVKIFIMTVAFKPTVQKSIGLPNWIGVFLLVLLNSVDL